MFIAPDIHMRIAWSPIMLEQLLRLLSSRWYE